MIADVATVASARAVNGQQVLGMIQTVDTATDPSTVVREIRALSSSVVSLPSAPVIVRSAAQFVAWLDAVWLFTRLVRQTHRPSAVCSPMPELLITQIAGGRTRLRLLVEDAAVVVLTWDPVAREARTAASPGVLLPWGTWLILVAGLDLLHAAVTGTYSRANI